MAAMCPTRQLLFVNVSSHVINVCGLGTFPRSVFQLRASKLQALRRDGQRCAGARGEDGSARGLAGVMGSHILNVDKTIINYPPNHHK